MKGRKPTPFEVRKRRGNPGKRTLPEDVPRIPTASKLPPPPDVFDVIPEPKYRKQAVDDWNRIGQILLDQRILADVDLHNLEGFCLHRALWRFHFDRMWSQGGPHQPIMKWETIGRGKKAKQVKRAIPNSWGYHPDRGEVKEHEAQYNRYAAELGMTPSARMRVTKTSGKSKDDALARHLSA